MAKKRWDLMISRQTHVGKMGCSPEKIYDLLKRTVAFLDCGTLNLTIRHHQNGSEMSC
jgi:hypothetical protein